MLIFGLVFSLWKDKAEFIEKLFRQLDLGDVAGFCASQFCSSTDQLFLAVLEPMTSMPSPRKTLDSPRTSQGFQDLARNLSAFPRILEVLTWDCSLGFTLLDRIAYVAVSEPVRSNFTVKIV